MRLIGHLESDRDARTLGDFLYVQGIETQMEQDGGRWAIWVHEEEKLALATEWLEKFRANPADPQFQAGSPAEKLRKQAEVEQDSYRKRVKPARSMLPGLTSYGFGVVTYALICVCVIVFILSKMGDDLERVNSLLITPVREVGDFIRWDRHLGEIKSGQVWRLVTPIFIHFGIMHILFNMMWLKDLGSLFEARLKSWYLGLFVVVVAIGSNYLQYAVSGRPLFGGMSGVNYGLIGYCWLRGRLDPGSGLFLDKQNFIFALVWFGLCFTGWLGPIANGAHAGGLIMGLAWAYIDSRRK